MKRIIPFCIAMLASISVHSQTTEPVNLKTEEVLSLIKGKRISTNNILWGNVRLQFDDSDAVYASGSNFNNRGKWKVVDGKLCLEGPRFDYTGCGVVRKVGDEIQHLWPAGGVHFTFRAP
jgi:hypothetical protein